MRYCSSDGGLFFWETGLEYSDNFVSLSGITMVTGINMTVITMVTGITMTVVAMVTGITMRVITMVTGITMTVVTMVTGITAGNSYQKKRSIIRYAKGLGKNNDSTIACQPRISVNSKGWKLLMNNE